MPGTHYSWVGWCVLVTYDGNSHQINDGQSHTHTHARTHARTLAHTHTEEETLNNPHQFMPAISRSEDKHVKTITSDLRLSSSGGASFQIFQGVWPRGVVWHASLHVSHTVHTPTKNSARICIYNTRRRHSVTDTVLHVQMFKG